MDAWKNNWTRRGAVGATGVIGMALAIGASWVIGDGGVAFIGIIVACAAVTSVEEATRPWRTSAYGLSIGDAVLAIGADGMLHPAWVQAFGAGEERDVIIAMGEHGEHGSWAMREGDLHRLEQA